MKSQEETVSDISSIIKERGYAKGQITKAISNLKAIPKNPDNVGQTKAIQMEAMGERIHS